MGVSELKLWEVHSCKCGKKLIHLMGAPHFGVVWAGSYEDLDLALTRKMQPKHDVFVYKGGVSEKIEGKCSG